jgi:hypothetical protein
MMRLLQASTIAALCVLASAATAYAECAWVVWAEPTTPSTGWSIPRISQVAFSGLVECERAANDENEKQFRRMIDKEKGRPAQGTLRCLPDTVDPRGPQGK